MKKQFNLKILFFIISIFIFIFILGAIFEKSFERNIYKSINYIWDLKKFSNCSNDEIINVSIKSRKPIRKFDGLKANDIWNVDEKKLNICPKRTAILLIGVWRLYPNEIKTDVQKKIVQSRIFPVVSKLRTENALIIHSPDGHTIYPGLFNEKHDINLNWTVLLPRKIQTIILFWKLKSKGINTLIYSGFSTNLSVYESAHGIYFTKLFDNYLQRLLLRDGTSSWVFSKSDFNKNYIKYLEWKHIPSLSSIDLM